MRKSKANMTSEEIKEKRKQLVQLLDKHAPALDTLAQICFEIAELNGFYDGAERDEDLNFGERCALLHSEISEAFESYRKFGYEGRDDHLPQHSAVKVEIIDNIVRSLDMYRALLQTGPYMSVSPSEVFFDKCMYNIERPYKHNKSC